MYKVLDDSNTDGTVLGQSSSAKVALWGAVPIPQFTTPMQANIQNMPLGTLTTFTFGATPIGCASGSTQEFAFTVSLGTSGALVATTDFLLAINPVSAISVGSGFAGIRNSAVSLNTLIGNEINVTGLAATPAAGLFTAVIATGFPTVYSAITPAAVASLTSAEQIFTIGGMNAAGSAVLDNSGHVVGVYVTTAGQGYYMPPQVVFAGGGPLGGVTSALPGSGASGIIGGSPFSPGSSSNFGYPNVSGAGNVVGTALMLESPAASATYPYGSGACGTAVVSGGGVVGVIMTHIGSGYQAAPTVSFVGGNTFSVGMEAHMAASGVVSGCGFGNVRVAGPNQIGITFINPSTSVVTPPSGNYRFLVANGFPPESNILLYQYQNGFSTGVTSGGTTEFTITVGGILATDVVLGVSKPSNQSGLTLAGYRAGTGNIYVDFMAGLAGTPTQNEVYSSGVLRQNPAVPSTVYQLYEAPTYAITANSGAEIPFTVTGTVANGAANVNTPVLPAGLSVAGARVSAANTVAVNFVNATATAIIPPAGMYTFETFNTPSPITNNGSFNSCSQSIGISKAGVFDAVNEIINALKTAGIIAGR
jgi:hypothetical protein